MIKFPCPPIPYKFLNGKIESYDYSDAIKRNGPGENSFPSYLLNQIKNMHFVFLPLFRCQGHEYGNGDSAHGISWSFHLSRRYSARKLFGGGLLYRCIATFQILPISPPELLLILLIYYSFSYL